MNNNQPSKPMSKKLLVEISGYDQNGQAKTINIKLPSTTDWKKNLEFVNKKIIKKFALNQYSLQMQGKTFKCNDCESFEELVEFGDDNTAHIDVVECVSGRQIIVHYGARKQHKFMVAEDLSKLNDTTFDNLVKEIKATFKIKGDLGQLYEDVGGKRIDIDDWDDLSDCLEDKDDGGILHIYLEGADIDHAYANDHDEDDEKAFYPIESPKFCIPLAAPVVDDNIHNYIADNTFDDGQYPVWPLIMPNNCSFDVKTKQMKVNHNEPRTKLVIFEPVKLLFFRFFGCIYIYMLCDLKKKALEFIRSISSKIAVISIVGKARKGKSYIAGELYAPQRIPCPFDLGHKMDACTYGIWISAKAIKHPNDNDTVILIMDVEGTGFHKATKKNDMQLMVITLLLSSYFVYNSMGSFDASSLDELKFVTELTQNIHSAPNEDDGQSFKKFFPKFMWLLRDVHLDPTIDDQVVTPRDYLTKVVLKFNHSIKMEEMQKQFTRSAFMQMFKDYDAFTLPSPTANDKILKNLAIVKRSALNPKFNQKSKIFRDKVLKETQCKMLYSKLNGKDHFEYCTGPHLAQFMKTFVDAVNSDKIPDVSSLSIDAVINVCKETKTKSIKEYERLLNTELLKLRGNDDKQPLDEHDIIKLHLSIYDKILNGVGRSLQCIEEDDQKCDSEIDRRKFKVFDEFCQVIGHNIKYTDRIGKDGGIMNAILSKNEKLSTIACNAYLNEYFAKSIEPMLDDEQYCIEDIYAKFNDLENVFYTKCKGPSKEECWKQFKNLKKDSSIQQFKKFKNLSDKIMEQQKKNDEQREINEKNERRIAEQNKKVELQQKYMKDEIARIENAAKAESAKMKAQHQQQMQQETKRLTDAHSAQFKTFENSLKQQMQTMKQTQTQTINALKQQHAAALKSQQDAMKKTVDELKNKYVNYHPYPYGYHHYGYTRFSFNYYYSTYVRVLDGGTRVETYNTGCPWAAAATSTGWTSGIHTWAFRILGLGHQYQGVGVCKNPAKASQSSAYFGTMGAIATYTSFSQGDIVTVTLDLVSWKVIFLRNGNVVSTVSISTRSGTFYPCLQMCGCKGYNFQLL